LREVLDEVVGSRVLSGICRPDGVELHMRKVGRQGEKIPLSLRVIFDLGGPRIVSNGSGFLKPCLRSVKIDLDYSDESRGPGLVVALGSTWWI